MEHEWNIINGLREMLIINVDEHNDFYMFVTMIYYKSILNNIQYYKKHVIPMNE